MVVDTTGTRWAKDSRIFTRVPLPKRIGTSATSAMESSRSMLGTRPTTVTEGGLWECLDLGDWGSEQSSGHGRITFPDLWCDLLTSQFAASVLGL